jgi:hypothetical protein
MISDTFKRMRMLASPTLGSPRPNRVDIICKIENVLAQQAAKIIRAVRLSMIAGIVCAREGAYHHAN